MGGTLTRCVNLRRPEEANELGNRFGLVIVSLPVGVRDPLERMDVLKQRMDTIKNTPEAIVAFGLLNTMGMTPIQVEKLIIDFFVAKVSAVMTNVPVRGAALPGGSRNRRHDVLGASARQPQPGNQHPELCGEM